MPVQRVTQFAAFLCALLAFGCRGTPARCPQGTVSADPAEIPDGTNETHLRVDVSNPFPENDLAVVTEITTIGGSIDDAFARSTSFACANDVSGPVEICVNTTYVESAAGEATLSEVPGVGASPQYLRRPHVRLPDPLDCSVTKCVIVTCPEEKNVCPEVSDLTVEPSTLSEGETATVTVVAEDPDDNPDALVTTLSARNGTIADPHAAETTYVCDPDVGGVTEICVVASDGDSTCDVQRCTSVQCPGDPSENTCPIIESLTAMPLVIEPPDVSSFIRVAAIDPDEFPVPLRTELSSDTGVFLNRFASETDFVCGASGPVEICVKANDGDPDCDERDCITVQCPSEIPANLCPQLFVINGIPRVIPAGQTSTRVETRGQDTDGLPSPLTLTLSALWGSLENTDNIQEPFNVVAQDAIYVCDRPGPVEICVDATDGACTKTLCDNVVCPDDIPEPP